MQGFPLNAREVAAALGGEVSGRNSVSAPGPGHSKADRSMSIRIDPRAPGGFVVTSFAGDDALDCKDYVRQQLGIEEWKPAQHDDAPVSDWVSRMEARVRKASDTASLNASNSNEASDGDRLLGIAMRMWGEAKPLKGSLAETYLQARGLWLPRNVEAAGQLRFHPSCAFKVKDGSTKRVPAMLALMTDPLTGEARAVHRTALKPDGSGKLIDPDIGNPKKMLGRMRGAVIRLCPDAEVTTALTIAEGIENAVAGICGGVASMWAAGAALNIQLLPALPGIETLHILADAGKAGEDAATECGQRWANEGRKVEATFPTNGDWNDTMKGAA